MSSLVWLRNDLRVRDNPALYRASEINQGVVVVYVVCREFVDNHIIAPVRLDFIRRHLQIVSAELAQLNMPFVIKLVDKAVEIPQVLHEIIQDNNCERLYFNAEYPLDELNRDRKVADYLRAQDIEVKRFHDRVIVPPGMIRNGQNEPYKVFTAFKRKWLQTVMPLRLQALPVPIKQTLQENASEDSSTQDYEQQIDSVFEAFQLRNLEKMWPAGEKAATKKLTHFINHSIHDYKKERDIPGVDGTSSLSPYLVVGSISPRQCLVAALAANNGEWDTGSEGVTCWIGELIWREFYQHVAVDYPDVCKYKAMQRHTEAFPWRKSQADFQRWCEGQTGIPIVDAAMLQLKDIGWMHNRLRMVVAMFLTKNLQIDWRWGENYFMSQLIDGDFSANNGGWQWSASTGTDAAPYFRIFNPVNQSERFDPEGVFIRQYLPELKHLSNKHIHNPPPQKKYPEPMVDLKTSRKNTIEIFGQLA